MPSRSTLSLPAHARFVLSAAGLLLVCGCSTPQKDDPVEFPDVFTSNGAPWTFGSVQTALFATSPSNTPTDGVGVLYLSDTTVSCDALLNIETEWDWDQLTLNGNGFVYQIEYDDIRSGGSGLSNFEHTWVGGYSANLSTGEEWSMVSLAFRDGVLYAMSYYGGQSWLDIQSASSAGVAGEFMLGWWAGTFTAEYCGDWTERSRDSGDGGDTW